SWLAVVRMAVEDDLAERTDVLGGLARHCQSKHGRRWSQALAPGRNRCQDRRLCKERVRLSSQLLSYRDACPRQRTRDRTTSLTGIRQHGNDLSRILLGGKLRTHI